MSFRFLPDPTGIQAVIREPPMVAFINERVQDILGEAVSNAPGDQYRASLGSTPAEATTDGVHGEVWSSSSFWHIIEFGSVNNPPYRVLERAVTASGLEFRDER